MAGEELLSSWNDTPTRHAIVDFVDAVTGDGPDHVPVPARVAVFDNDGTLWTEKPMPTQLHFIVKKWKEQVQADPSLADRQPYKAVVEGDLGWLGGEVVWGVRHRVEDHVAAIAPSVDSNPGAVNEG